MAVRRAGWAHGTQRGEGSWVLRERGQDVYVNYVYVYVYTPLIAWRVHREEWPRPWSFQAESFLTAMACGPMRAALALLGATAAYGTLIGNSTTRTSGDTNFVYVLSVDVGWPDASWNDAEAICRANGFYLARILSARDQNRVRTPPEAPSRPRRGAQTVCGSVSRVICRCCTS